MNRIVCYFSIYKIVTIGALTTQEQALEIACLLGPSLMQCFLSLSRDSENSKSFKSGKWVHAWAWSYDKYFTSNCYNVQEILHKPLTPAKPILAAETPLSEFGMRRLSTPEVPTLVIRRHLSAALCVFFFYFTSEGRWMLPNSIQSLLSCWSKLNLSLMMTAKIRVKEYLWKRKLSQNHKISQIQCMKMW